VQRRPRQLFAARREQRHRGDATEAGSDARGDERAQLRDRRVVLGQVLVRVRAQEHPRDADADEGQQRDRTSRRRDGGAVQDDERPPAAVATRDEQRERGSGGEHHARDGRALAVREAQEHRRGEHAERHEHGQSEPPHAACTREREERQRDERGQQAGDRRVQPVGGPGRGARVVGVVGHADGDAQGRELLEADRALVLGGACGTGDAQVGCRTVCRCIDRRDLAHRVHVGAVAQRAVAIDADHGQLHEQDREQQQEARTDQLARAPLHLAPPDHDHAHERGGQERPGDPRVAGVDAEPTERREERECEGDSRHGRERERAHT
jgi:hypothetical protein